MSKFTSFLTTCRDRHGSTSRRSVSAALLGSLLLALVAGGCSSSSSGGGSGKAKSSSVSVAPNTPIRVRGEWTVYIADEATTESGVDFNGDGDMIDGIATAFQMKDKDEFPLGVAAIDVFIVDEEIYILTDESLDGRDWSADGMLDDFVLIHWSQASGRLTFVDATGPGPNRVAAAANRLYYVSADIPNGADTNLKYLRSDNPTSSVTIQSEDGGPRQVGIVGIEELMLFLNTDETIEGEDLNGDGDTEDEFVLALIDTTNPSAMLLSTELAIAGLNQPFRAKQIGTGDWIVAFPVSEKAHSDLTGGGFNDPANFSPTWQPSQCSGAEDSDLDDTVLHFLHFSDWMNDPVNNPPVNTGLVCRRRIAIADSDPYYIATISFEFDEGTCDLNQDGDRMDSVVRWVEAREPVLPFTSASELFALADVEGGTRGIGELEFAFFIAVSEEDQDVDIDGDGEEESDILAWMNPEDGNGSFWMFDQDEGAGIVVVGTDWMGESAERERLLSTFQESVFGAPINTGDNDLNDSIPTWAFIDDSDEDLDFPGENVAAERANAGMVRAKKYIFYRVDERADNRDWNNDGDIGDSVLFRTHIDKGSSDFISTLNDFIRPSIVVGPIESGLYAGVFIANEAMEDKDINKDGDRNDFVIRYVKL